MDDNGLEDSSMDKFGKLQQTLLMALNDIFPFLNGYVLWSELNSWFAFVGGVVGCWILDAALLVRNVSHDDLFRLPAYDIMKSVCKKCILLQLSVYVFLKIVFI